MSLRATLRKDATQLLDKLVVKVHDAAKAIADEHNLDRVDLLRLAIGGRTASLSKRVVSILAAEQEKELLALYQKTGTAPAVTDIGKASGKTGG